MLPITAGELRRTQTADDLVLGNLATRSLSKYEIYASLSRAAVIDLENTQSQSTVTDSKVVHSGLVCATCTFLLLLLFSHTFICTESCERARALRDKGTNGGQRLSKFCPYLDSLLRTHGYLSNPKHLYSNACPTSEGEHPSPKLKIATRCLKSADLPGYSTVPNDTQRTSFCRVAHTTWPVKVLSTKHNTHAGQDLRKPPK